MKVKVQIMRIAEQRKVAPNVHPGLVSWFKYNSEIQQQYNPLVSNMGLGTSDVGKLPGEKFTAKL